MQLRSKDFGNGQGFFWTDLPDAEQRLGQRQTRTDPAILRHFIERGYATESGAVSEKDIATFLAALYGAIETPDSGLYVTFWDAEGKKHLPAQVAYLGEREAKVLDVHHHLPASHPLIFSPAILAFLRDVFGEDPVAFQTLYFEYGSTQGAHNDTAFVYVDPPHKLVASWIALEDIEPDTGELFYYPGSQRIGDQIFANGGKAYDREDEHAHTYSRTLEEMMAAHGLARETFVPQKSDVLFWAADLVHGGTEILRRRTRRSLVTHYCPLSASVPYAKHLGKVPQPTPQGGWIVSAT